MLSIGRKPTRRLQLLPLVPWLLFIGLLHWRHAAAESPTTAAPPSESAKAGGHVVPEIVHVGLYMIRIPDLDIKSNAFQADFYLWFRWSGPVDPTQSFELTNGIDLTNMTKVPAYADASGNPAPDTLTDGAKYQVFHVHGRFGQPFNVRAYPFDEQDLTIQVEDAQHNLSELRYQVDDGSTGVHPKFDIPGWNVISAKAQILDSTFGTNFGDPRVTAGSDSYSHFQFSVHLDRPVMSLVGKLVVPMAIVVLITLLSLFLHPDSLGERLSLTVTAMLSVVALQFTAASELPSIGYMTLLDKIYLLTYFVIFLAIALAVSHQRLIQANKPELAIKLDRSLLVVLLVLFFGGTELIIQLR